MVAGLRPMLLGGWSNKALDSKLQFDDCSVSCCGFNLSN